MNRDSKGQSNFFSIVVVSPFGEFDKTNRNLLNLYQHRNVGQCTQVLSVWRKVNPSRTPCITRSCRTHWHYVAGQTMQKAESDSGSSKWKSAQIVTCLGICWARHLWLQCITKQPRLAARECPWCYSFRLSCHYNFALFATEHNWCRRSTHTGWKAGTLSAWRYCHQSSSYSEEQTEKECLPTQDRI